MQHHAPLALIHYMAPKTSWLILQPQGTVKLAGFYFEKPTTVSCEPVGLLQHNLHCHTECQMQTCRQEARGFCQHDNMTIARARFLYSRTRLGQWLLHVPKLEDAHCHLPKEFQVSETVDLNAREYVIAQAFPPAHTHAHAHALAVPRCTDVQ
jgi:hypothetical protein